MAEESISVVIPAYNEAKRILPTLERVWEYFTRRSRDFEIIVVDDGSTDGTSELVAETAKQLSGITLLRSLQNHGKGNSVKRGILSARKKLCLISDADLSTPVEEVEKFEAFIDKGYDIVIGSRGLPESEIVRRQRWHREQMGKAFNIIVRILMIGGIRDTQCGFKLFRADAAKRIFEMSMIGGFSFDAEVLFIARKSGKKIKEVPVRWIDSRFSKVRILSDPFWMFFDLLRIRFYWLLGRYSSSARNHSSAVQKDDRKLKI